MKIAVDAMGGDKAPAEIIKGAVLAVQKYSCEIVLVGDEEKIREEFDETKNLPITIRHAAQVIEMGEHPTEAIRNKKNSSIVVATKMVKDGECDAVLSAGSTGASVGGGGSADFEKNSRREQSGNRNTDSDTARHDTFA